MKTDWFTPALVMLASITLIFIVAPLAKLFLTTPLQNIIGVFSDGEVLESIRITLLCSLWATGGGTLFGVPLAYLLARRKFPGKAIVQGIVNLPVVIPHSVAGIALLFVLGRQSAMGRLARESGFDFVGSEAGITLAMAFVSLPFLVNLARDGFLSVPLRLEKVAKTLGASPARVFFTISLPLAWRSILSGMVMMWARGISEFGAVMIIAYYPKTTPVLVFQRFCDHGLAHAQSAAVLLVSICVVIFLLLQMISGSPGKEEADAGA
jgi:molybdate/tungstate transport system permease protein